MGFDVQGMQALYIDMLLICFHLMAWNKCIFEYYSREVDAEWEEYHEI